MKDIKTMDELLKSMVFGLVFISILVLTAPFFHKEEVEQIREIDAAIEKEEVKNVIAYTYSEWADYPSEFLVG